MRLPSVRTVATVEALGGAFSLVGLLGAWPAAWPGAYRAAGYAFALLAGAASVAAGVLLWRGSPVGRELSLAVLAAQVPRLTVPGVAYALTVGAEATLRLLADWNVELTAEARAAGRLWLGHHDAPFELGVNLLALALLVALRRAAVPTTGRLPAAAAESTPPAV